MAAIKKLKITQIKSGIGYRQKTKQTLAALGFRKMNQSVIKVDSAAIRGMLKNIDFLVKVEEIK